MPRTQRHNYGIVAAGLIEIAIGLATLMAVISALLSGVSQKSPEVLVFVITTSLVSFGLGIGMLLYSLTAYHLLLFFSGTIVLSKILIFANIITLNGELETEIPQAVKNTASILYHCGLIVFLRCRGTRDQFKQKHSPRFSLHLLW